MQRRSDEGVVFANIVPGHRMKRCRRLPVRASSKTKLVQLMVEYWKSRKARHYRQMTVTY